MSYEEKIKQVEEIIGKLDNGKLTLEESLNCFETATKCLKECNDELNATKGKVFILKQQLDEIIEDEFNE